MQFLSDEHLAAATAAFGADPDLVAAARGVALRIVYFVSDGPDGDFSYYITVADDAVKMARGALDSPDAEVRSSYATAVGLSKGEVANQTAVMMGKIRIKGSMMALLRHVSLLNRVQAISSSLPVEY